MAVGSWSLPRIQVLGSWPTTNDQRLSFSDRSSFNLLFVNFALKDPFHVNTGRVNQVWFQFTHLDQMLNLGNRYFCRRRHHGIKIPRGLAIDEIAPLVALPRLDQGEIGLESAL